VVKVVNGDGPVSNPFEPEEHSTASTIAALMDTVESPLDTHEDEALRMF
jgi:hypothetical protein